MQGPLEAISPVDGRYAGQTNALTPFFSEAALFRYRLRVEIEYFIALSKLGINRFPALSEKQIDLLQGLVSDFSTSDALRIKEIEKKTNHDIKALEYYIKEKFDEFGLGSYREWVHFGLTSQDINNTAIPLLMKEACEQVLFPALNNLSEKLESLARQWKNVAMLARTHGQPASPTSLGKEFYVFAERLSIQLNQLQNSVWAAKFGGATGNFNAHHVAFPQINWVEFANNLLNQLGLYRSRTTTQIEHYDHLAAFCHNLSRIHTVLLDLSRDCWMYISMEYFRQKVKTGETGSSAMPHKVNPIDFENAEGNLGLANALLGHFAEKLPISRLQRDLSDSTVLRNIGLPFAYSLIALNSLQKGLDKLLLNENAIREDLQHNASVIAEAIQTVLRREGVANPYEMLKDFTRGRHEIGLADLREFIQSLDVNEQIKAELLNIDPLNYTGIVSIPE